MHSYYCFHLSSELLCLLLCCSEVVNESVSRACKEQHRQIEVRDADVTVYEMDLRIIKILANKDITMRLNYPSNISVNNVKVVSLFSLENLAQVVLKFRS